LVPIEQKQDGSGIPLDADRFVADLAHALTDAVSDPARAAAMGLAGRKRAVDSFSWATIGERTLDVYRGVLAG
jgi:starch synthase